MLELLNLGRSSELLETLLENETDGDLMEAKQNENGSSDISLNPFTSCRSCRVFLVLAATAIF